MTDAPEKRKPLTRAQFGQLIIDQEGKCACGCGQKLQPMTEGVIDEHYRPLGLLGTNEYENRRLYRKPCAKAKTHGKDGDNSRTATAKRQGRKCLPRAPEDREPGSIRSRRFNQNLTKRMNGTVVARGRNTPAGGGR